MRKRRNLNNGLPDEAWFAASGDEDDEEPSVELSGESAELPVDADAPCNQKEAVPLQAFIAQALSNLGKRQDSLTAKLARDWDVLLPRSIALVTRPGNYDNGVVYVHVRTNMHLYQVRQNYLNAIFKALMPLGTPEEPIRRVQLQIKPASFDGLHENRQ